MNVNVRANGVIETETPEDRQLLQAALELVKTPSASAPSVQELPQAAGAILQQIEERRHKAWAELCPM